MAKQRKMSRRYSDAKPSEVTDVAWIHAENKSGEYPKPTARSGKWLVFVNATQIDEVWQRVKKALEEGRLGDSAKVATAKPHLRAANPNQKVICVYTYDSHDAEDVRRIREELRNLGMTAKMPYKEDKDTLNGKYVTTGHRGISKYYE